MSDEKVEAEGVLEEVAELAAEEAGAAKRGT